MTQTTSQTTSSTTPAASYPPGMSKGGLDSPLQLAGAHAKVLNQGSWEVTMQETITYQNGTTYANQNTAAKYNGSNVLATTTYAPGTVPSSATYSDQKAWTNGSITYLMQTPVGGNPSVSNTSGGINKIPFASGTDAWKERLYVLLASGDVSVSTQGDNYVVTASGNPTVSTSDYGDVTAKEIKFTVTQDGFVQSYHFTFTTKIDGNTVTIDRFVTFTSGGVSAEQPSWAK